MVKWRYCYIGFVDTQHNFEITLRITVCILLEFCNDIYEQIYIFLNIKKHTKNTRYILRFYNINFSKCDSPRCNFYAKFLSRLSTFCISPTFKTLLFFLIFPYYSICHLFCQRFFYISGCHSVTSHTASKLNHKHNNQKQYGFVMKKHS